jgi:hypothetical protein
LKNSIARFQLLARLFAAQSAANAPTCWRADWYINGIHQRATPLFREIYLVYTTPQALYLQRQLVYTTPEVLCYE